MGRMPCQASWREWRLFIVGTLLDLDFEFCIGFFMEQETRHKKGLNAFVPLVQVVDKFGQRWRALKPQEMKDWSTTEVDRVFAALSQWREQFQEHKNKVGGGGGGTPGLLGGFKEYGVCTRRWLGDSEARLRGTKLFLGGKICMCDF